MIDSASSYLQSNLVADVREQQVDRTHVVDTSVIAPAFNEEEALPCVLTELVATLNETYEIIIVDDGSADRTSAIAGEYPVRLIKHEQNQGKGAAMRTGINEARGQKIIFIDADATYPIDRIPAIAECLDQYDFVRGVRRHGRDNMPFINRLGNSLFEFAIHFVHHVDSIDALTGLYGLRTDVLRRMRLGSTGFDIESEIVIKAGSMGLRSICIPIEYAERIGEKKLNAFCDGLQILRRVLVLAILFKPFVTYVLPGLALWILALFAMLALSRGPVRTGWAGFTTNTFIVVTMAFLAGFQLIAFGTIANLYAHETGLGVPSRSLSTIARVIPRTGWAILAVLMIVAGVIGALYLIGGWLFSGFGPFTRTESLVLYLAVVVWGMQILSTMFVLSLFVSSANPLTNGSSKDGPSAKVA
ncbi:MAG: glycosyltransferase family 2 protein [Candidatus Promineifilaceae bacterium]